MYKQEIKGETSAERKKTAKELREKGFTEEKIDGNHKYTLIKEDGYNDDMKSIVEEAKKGRREIGFFIGHAQRKFDNGKVFLIDGIKVSDTKILLRYDGFFAPQKLLKHEKVHIEWNTPKMQEIKGIILDNLTDAEKERILSDERYQKYMKLYNNETDIVWEEFVADVLADMNDYAHDYVEIAADYNSYKKDIDSYKVSEYDELIDTGDVNLDVLENIGFGEEFKLSERGDLSGYDEVYFSGKLGRLNNRSTDKGSPKVGSVGQTQSQTPNTPRTKKVHRSGVSAETITSSGQTVEQTVLKEENLFNGYDTEFYIKARQNGIEKTKPFNTSHTQYIPDAEFERNGIVIKDGVASFTQKRFNDLIEEFSVPVGGVSNQNYAKGYVAYISPSEFLSLTTLDESRIIEDTKTNKKYGGGTLDVKELAENRQTPFLIIDFKSGEVYGHEGRHQMVMLRNKGINKVAIVVESLNPEADKYRTNKMTNFAVTGQEYSRGRSPGKVTFDEIIPLSPAYRDEVTEKFVINKADIRYALGTYDSDSERLTPERKKQIFEQFEKDRAGMPKQSQKEIWGERASWIAHNMARVFPKIPERGEKGTFFAEFRKNMVQWKNLANTASFMVQDKLNKMTDGLTAEEFKTFSELVYFLDLQEEVQLQRDRGYDEILLPNKITPIEVDEIVKVLNDEATENVKQALIKRQNIWDELKDQYISLNQYIGFDTDGKFKRKNYYHHQIIEYMNGKGKGTGSREIGIKADRGWLKERQGSTKAINTDFLAVEYKAMLQMQYDV